jgi:hypothetical protein
MPETPPPATPRRPPLKYVLLGAAGGALILLPLGQVLRYQGAELTALAAERAALDPLALALGVQRSVIAHRDASDRVLRGRPALEAERRIRQAELDQRLRDLQDTLTAGWWMRALQETQSLAGDWRQLARLVALRQINPADSLDAHQLLMEQAVQVMDLVQAAAPAGGSGALAAWSARQLLPLPAPGTQNRQQALAALEAALLLQDAGLLERSAAVRAQRAALGLALGALLALGLTRVLRRAAARPPADPTRDTPAPGEGAGQRRSHGRRATDLPPQPDETGPLMDRLRSGDVPRASEPR